MKITKRDITFFILGIVTFFIAGTIYDWEDSKKAFEDGFYGVSKTEATK
jgi:hypothetical protein